MKVVTSEKYISLISHWQIILQGANQKKRVEDNGLEENSGDGQCM